MLRLASAMARNFLRRLHNGIVYYVLYTDLSMGILSKCSYFF